MIRADKLLILMAVLLSLICVAVMAAPIAVTFSKDVVGSTETYTISMSVADAERLRQAFAGTFGYSTQVRCSQAQQTAGDCVTVGDLIPSTQTQGEFLVLQLGTYMGTIVAQYEAAQIPQPPPQPVIDITSGSNKEKL